MSVPFSFSRKLTPDQCKSIRATLESHGIAICEDKFHALCMGVERALKLYCRNPDYLSATSRAQTLTEIKRLKNAIGMLSQSAQDVLADAFSLTETYKEGRGSGLTSDNPILDSESGLPGFLARAMMEILKESCELALSETPPSRLGKSCDIVAANTARTGRPKKRSEQFLVARLSVWFNRCTDQRATDTEYGPFDDFLSECLKVVNLNIEQGTNRKLIRAALYDKPGHVPKPRKTK